MNLLNGSRFRGTRVIACSLIASGVLAAAQASADTIFTVNGVDVDSAVVDLFFENQLGGPGAQATPEQREALMSALKDIYILATQDRAAELASDPRLAAQIELQRLGLIAQAFATDFITNTEVTEEELLAEYGVQIENAPPLQYKARHILVATQGEATDLITQLNDGADFEELAKEHSTGPSGPNGGDLGWFAPNQMVAPFSQAVELLEDGQHTSEPVQTQFGWHVILREESRETEPPTFESIRDQIVQVVQRNKFEAHLESLRGSMTQ